MHGVIHTRVGYAGGTKLSPTYRDMGDHTEAIEITYDPELVSYEQLLRVFWESHRPYNEPWSVQYRSAIFYHDDEQKKIAEEDIKDLEAQKIWDDPIVTTIETLDVFYPAEDYHDDYFARNGGQPYCAAVIAPKVAKFRQRFAHRLGSAV